jgi:hypothetical protein
MEERRPAAETVDQMQGGGRKTKSKSRPTIKTAVSVDDIAAEAGRLFDALAYRGADGGNLWKVAALLETGIGDLSECDVYDAAEGARRNGRDKPAHFWRTLENTLAASGRNLSHLVAQVNIVPDWPREHPCPEGSRSGSHGGGNGSQTSENGGGNGGSFHHKPADFETNEARKRIAATKALNAALPKRDTSIDEEPPLHKQALQHTLAHASPDPTV